MPTALENLKNAERDLLVLVNALPGLDLSLDHRLAVFPVLLAQFVVLLLAALAQLALAWTLRDPRVTSALIGASRPEQIVENVGALQNLAFSSEELAEIDRFAQEGGINLWEKPSTAE